MQDLKVGTAVPTQHLICEIILTSTIRLSVSKSSLNDSFVKVNAPSQHACFTNQQHNLDSSTVELA